MGIFEKLNAKIDELITKISTLQEENATLRQELVQIKAQCEVKTAEITRLQELNAQKDKELSEIEELIAKIEDSIA